MATIKIDGVGTVQVDDSFLHLSPADQEATVHEIMQSMGGAAHTASHAASQALPDLSGVSPNQAFNALIQQESGNHAGVLGPVTQFGQAVGAAQTLPSTAKDMAAKLGLEFRPDLLHGTSNDALQYQKILGRAYFDEGLKKYGGNIAKALMYYYGGPDERQWGPKTEQYVHDVLSHLPNVTNAPAPSPADFQAPPMVGDADGPDTEGPSDNDAPPPVGFTDAQKAKIMAYLPKAKSPDDLVKFAHDLTGGALTIGNAPKVFQYLRKGGDPSKLVFAPPAIVQRPQTPNPDNSPLHVASVASRGLVQGVLDIPGMVGNAVLDPIRNAGERVGNLVNDFSGHPERNTENSGTVSNPINSTYAKLLGSTGAPQTTLDKYIAATGEGVGSALIPWAGGAGDLANLVKAGVGATVGGQAASYLFPGSAAAPVIGSILGGGIANPDARMAATSKIPHTKGNIVASIKANPLGPELVDVSRGYKTLAEQVHPKGAAPKGRQPLSVEEINAVGDRGLKGLREKISKSGASQADKTILIDALNHAVEIPLERTPDMGPDQLALSDLPDTVEGRAVKAAIRRAKAGDMLSARYGGEKLGPMKKAFNLGVKALPIPYFKEFLQFKGGDINKSRMDAAAKAIKRSALFEKAAGSLPDSGYGPAMSALNDKVMQTATAADAAKAAKAAARARAIMESQQVRTSNDLLTRRVERNIVRPKDGYRGLIYQETGVTQPVQDQALLYMVKKGEIDPADLPRIMAHPETLMKNKGKAGLKIMDRIGELADQGIIKRDPDWKGPPEPAKMPVGVTQWLDAQGVPIRSMGAYAGGIAKNIVREQTQKADFDEKIGSEPAKPAPKTKRRKKPKKQGA